MDVAGDGHLCPDRGDVNHVAGKQWASLDISPKYQQIVQIEVTDGLPIAPQLNVAERPLDGGATGGKQRGDQGAERTQGVGSRAARLAYDKHLDRAQLPHFDIEIEALVNMADSVMNMLP